MNNAFVKFKQDEQLTALDLTKQLTHIGTALETFTEQARLFHFRLSNETDLSDYRRVAQCNEQLRSVERAFLNARVGMTRTGNEHMVFSISTTNNYGGNFFPSIEDAVFTYYEEVNKKEPVEPASTTTN